MKLEVGSEKRFSEFIGKLNDKDKIALLSHTDQDGLVSARVANEVIDADILRFVDYYELDSKLIKDLRKQGVNKVVTTDLFMTSPEFMKGLEENFEALVIDHHPVIQDWNSDKIVFINCENGFCAAYLCYELFKKIKNLEKIDWLVACACVADWCYFKNGEWLSKVFEKYDDKFEINCDAKAKPWTPQSSKEARPSRGETQELCGIIRKSGKFWDLQWEISLGIVYFKDDLRKVYDFIGSEFGDIGGLRGSAAEVQKEINETMARFRKERKEFSDGYYYRYAPRFMVGSIVSSVLSTDEPEKTFILVKSTIPDYYGVNARRQDKKIDMGKFLKKLVDGLENADAGGHSAAAGGHFMKKDLEEFKKRLGVRE